MKLIFDIGNTNVVCGAFQGAELIGSFRLRSDRDRTVDEYSLDVISLLKLHNIDRTEIKGTVIGSVVPQLTRMFSKLSVKYLDLLPQIIEAAKVTGMELHVDRPDWIGADQIANAYAARELYGAPCVVVDLGTATTFDIVGATGAFEGGLIAPGLTISAEALSSRAALLPSIELKEPKSLIGKNPRDAMLSGILFGYASLIDGLVQKLRAELGEQTKVVATGGLAGTIAKLATSIDLTNPDLTLVGFRLLAEQARTSDIDR